MKLFNKIKEKGLSPRQEQLALWCAGRLLARQRRLADWLNERWRNCRPPIRLLVLALLLLGLAGCYLTLIVANID